MASDGILEKILEARPVLHGAGAISAEALRAIARYAAARTILNSAETGCGSTTLLLSQLSRRHTVFALDVGGSISNVRRSPLLRSEAVTFVEGPSQRTLPAHRFDSKLQFALIDGPHAYPFPDLEYYYLYPHLEEGAILILDDIQIRSIHNLFQFLRADAMFRLDEVVRNTAFFTRTSAPVFDPLGDNWQAQNYNRRALLRHAWRSRLAGAVPPRLRRRWAARRSGCSIRIVSPAPGEPVTGTGMVAGRARLTQDAHLWVLVHRKDVAGWWPQGAGQADVASDGSWSVDVRYGDPGDAGFEFEIAAIAVSGAVNQHLLECVPPVALPPAMAEAFRVVRKA